MGSRAPLKWLVGLAALVALVGLLGGRRTSGQSDDFYEGPGVTVSQILRARGYLADDFYLRSADGYAIRITRGRSPLFNESRAGIEGRVPILFVHGVLESYNVFVINSFGASPSDFSSVDFEGLSLDELNERLGDEPSARALPLLAMDSAHEIFIMSRRGFPGSQQLAGNPLQGNSDASPAPTGGPARNFLSALSNYGNLLQQVPFSFDRKFWNFSMDEQARYDFAPAVGLVRNLTGAERIAVVGHSAGGTITLQALSMYPELNDQLSAVILWAQGFSLGHGDIFNALPGLLPFLQAYVGSVPPAFSTNQLDAFLSLICASQAAQSTLCEAFADLILGFSGGQEPIRPEFINSLLYPSSSHEIAQNIQCAVLGGQMHHYSNNLLLSPPASYNLSTITNGRLSFWTSATDFTVSAADVRATLPLLRVPYRFHQINGTFNHNGYFYHNNTQRLAIIPTLREIRRLSARPN